MRNLLFHGFLLSKHECHALYKNKSYVHDFCVQTIWIDIQHPCLNNAHDIDVRTIQIDK